MPQLSVCIAARNEEWLERTILDVFAHAKADTEVIVVLDGAWPVTPLPQHPRLQVIFVPEAIGQRAAVNIATRISSAHYVMKLDAHCSVADGFDVALIEAAKELGPNVVQIPGQKNLHVYDWVCESCGRREYQCGLDRCRACNGPIRKDVVWQARRGVHTVRWRFDADLHFQYWDKPKGDLIETMSCIGACWFIAREHWQAIGGLDEAHGSWGQVGTELACKVWLSGGRMVTNDRTWFAHFFRVGGQKFPYPIQASEQEAARVYSRDLWRHNRWPGQIHPLRWLIDKFWPVPGWTEEQRDALPGQLDRGITGHAPVSPDRVGVARSSGTVRTRTAPTKGVVYYTDNRLDPRIDAAVRARLDAVGLPLVAVSLKPIDWPRSEEAATILCTQSRNIVLPLERGYLTMFKQILLGLEAIDTEVVFFCEHDVLYSPTHFDFTPPDRERVFYNRNVWKVSARDGRALHYLCSQTSGLCADRRVLVEHYRKRVALVEQRGYTRSMGFEPGTHRREERVDDLTADVWMSPFPNVDIRHDTNLTPSRWRKDQFRNQKYTEGWREADAVPGWGVTRGRFDDFLREVTSGALQQAVA